MEKFTSKNFKILVIAAVACIGVLVYSLSAGSALLTDLFGIVSTPLLTAGTEMTAGTKEFINLDGMTRKELQALYTELAEENRLLREQLVDYHEMQEENASYKNILAVKETMLDLELIAANVVGRDPGDVFYDFTINRGTASGVSKGDAVITEMGIVGVIEEAYATSSRVRTILSEDSQVGAVAKESGESGVLTGDIQFAGSGKVRLSYLEKDTQVRAGSIVTTSGTGGMFPTDLLIGRVDGVERSAADGSYYAVVTPYADIRGVTDVFVVTGFEGEGDLYINMPASRPEDTAAGQ